MSYEVWFFLFQIYESVGLVWWRFPSYFPSIFVADYEKYLNSGRGTRFFSLLQNLQNALSVHKASYSLTTRVLSPGMKG